MRIKEITVTNLFGMFNYTIPFNIDQRITIIHGENGLGKTVILNLINDIFNKSFIKLLNTKFELIKIKFENNAYIQIQKDYDCEEDNSIILNFSKGRGKPQTVKIPEYAFYNDYDKYFTHKRRILRRDLERGIISEEDFHRFLEKEYHYRHRYEYTDRRQRHLFENRFGFEYNEKLYEIYKQLDVHVKLIETQRLTAKQTNSKEESHSTTVEKYAEDLSDKIKGILSEYTSKSQTLERTFPIRIIKKSEQEEVSETAIKKSLTDLENKRLGYVSLGILDQLDNTDFEFNEKIAKYKLAVLNEYIKDNYEKLEAFKELATKIKLFKEIINKRFKYKQIYFNKDKGFFFKNKNEDVIQLKNLSSGEQHQIILFYDFLFNLKPNSFVMIDEPELSLHIEWQREFLNDYKKITELSNIDLLIATHSPQLINNNWDLTVKLGE